MSTHFIPAARVLLAGLELIERRPPCSAHELHRWDALLCDAIALVERDASHAIPAVYASVAARRGAPPWWAFRPWQRLSLALRSQLAACNTAAEWLVLDLLTRGADAAPGTAAHWHAEWVAGHVLSEPAADGCIYRTAEGATWQGAAAP